MGYKTKDQSQALYDFMNQYMGSNENNIESNNETQEEADEFLEENSWLQNSNTISGTSIVEDESDVSLDELLKDVNSQNTESYEKERERLRKELEEKEEADRKIREAAQAQVLKEKYEEEQKVLEQIRKQEEEEELRLAEELEAKRKANPLLKLKETAATVAAKSVTSLLSKKPEENKELEEDKELQIQPQETIEDNNIEDSNIEENSDIEEVQNETQNIISDDSESKPSEESSKKIRKKEKPEKKDKKKKEEGILKAKDSATEKKADALDFEYLATHDQLTGLKNLTAYEIALQKCDEKKCAVLFCDINNLKTANDTLGHASGNKLIIAVADTLKELFKDDVYRIGGDEFIVLLEGKKPSELQKKIEENLSKLNAKMAQHTKEDTEGVVYSVSAGYALADGKKSVSELQEEADKLMYESKQKYKKAEEKKHPKKKEEQKPQNVDYDSLLPDEQRMLKEVIKDNHCQASEESTEKILREIQSRYNEIIAILIASPTFDYLFIIQDVENFINIATETDSPIDYSYLYVVYENGTQFYGVDEYFDEVTVLFTEIGKNIKTCPYISDKELLKIKGINTFKQIYFD